jgi:hypothetical protein
MPQKRRDAEQEHAQQAVDDQTNIIDENTVDTNDFDASEPEFKPLPKPKPAAARVKLLGTHVRRKFAFRRVEAQERLIPGEALFKRVGNAFVKCGRVPKQEENQINEIYTSAEISEQKPG